MKLLKQFIATGLLGLCSIQSANATIVEFSSCTGANDCLIAPGDIAIPNPVAKNPNNGYLIGWNETQNYTLTSDLRVDRVANPLASFVEKVGTDYLLKAGTVVSSHYFQWDPGAGSAGTVNATIGFDSEIFAFITATGNLASSDAFLGLPGLDYGTFTNRGLEGGDDTDFAPGGDNTLVDISWYAGNPGDWTRLITAYSPAAVVPEPSIIALMLGGLGLVGFMARRRKEA